MPNRKRNQETPRTGPPHHPGLRKLVEGRRKWHRPERTLPLPAEAGIPDAIGTSAFAGSKPEASDLSGSTPALGTRPTQVGVPETGGTPASAGSGKSPFLGWHERGYLPHFDAPNVTQFITFMRHDAFPVTRRREWESALLEPDDSARRRKLEAWLDRGHGDGWLRQPPIADLVESKLREHDGRNYRLQAWVIMPNHVHLVVEVWQTPLSELLKLWKGGSARTANLALHRSGSFWEREYFDTLIRDEAHLRQAIRYTEDNPVKAKLVAERKLWRWSSARWRDEYERLSFQREAAAE